MTFTKQGEILPTGCGTAAIHYLAEYTIALDQGSPINMTPLGIGILSGEPCSSIDSTLPVAILGHFEVQESGYVQDHRQNGDGDDEDQDAPRVGAGAGDVWRQHRIADQERKGRLCL